MVVDQFEQLIVEKANIFVCKERPDYEHVETDSTPVLYYSKDLGSVTTENEIAKICNVVRSNNASEVLPQSRPLCTAIVTDHLRRVYLSVLSDDQDAVHEKIFAVNFQEAKKRVDDARKTADLKMECDSMVTEAPHVKGQATRIVTTLKTFLGFVRTP